MYIKESCNTSAKIPTVSTELKPMFESTMYSPIFQNDKLDELKKSTEYFIECIYKNKLAYATEILRIRFIEPDLDIFHKDRDAVQKYIVDGKIKFNYKVNCCFPDIRKSSQLNFTEFETYLNNLELVNIDITALNPVEYCIYCRYNEFSYRITTIISEYKKFADICTYKKLPIDEVDIHLQKFINLVSASYSNPL